MAFEKNRDQIEAEEWFPYVLSKLYPIEWMQFASQPDQHGAQAPRFCWRYRPSDSSAYNRVEQAVSEFHGEVLWRLYAGYLRCCIAAVTLAGPSGGYLQTPPDLNPPEKHAVPAPDPALLAKAVEEIPKLCQHIEQRLGLRNVLPKPFAPESDGACQQKPLPRDLEDFVEPGMHVVWLVRDTAEFESHSGPASRSDRMLHFGVTRQEWQTIFLEVLNADEQKHGNLPNMPPGQSRTAYPAEPKAKVRAYPVLSRTRRYLYDLIFETGEVRLLRQECQHAMARTSSPVALRGLEKLSRICAEAIRLGLGIYMMSQ